MLSFEASQCTILARSVAYTPQFVAWAVSLDFCSVTLGRQGEAAGRQGEAALRRLFCSAIGSNEGSRDRRRSHAIAYGQRADRDARYEVVEQVGEAVRVQCATSMLPERIRPQHRCDSSSTVGEERAVLSTGVLGAKTAA